MIDLNDKLEKGYLLFYGFSYKHIPDQVRKNYLSRMNFYFKSPGQKNQLVDEVQIHRYSGYQDTGWDATDVVFLDQSAVKSLLIGYPSQSKYVLVNCLNFRNIHWIILGLLRRLIIRQVRFSGFKRLTHNGYNSYWIVLSRVQLINNNNFYLSRELGVEGFLKHLHSNHIKYVVPRFFESLPMLHREGGDLDIIVSDEDEKAVKNFLQENEGDIRVDVWTVNRPNYHGITYMPPLIAQEVIDKAKEGKALAKVPNAYDSLNCMIYHALYHKGFQGGIPSKYIKLNKKQSKNDYLRYIDKYAKQLDLTLDYSMESLDEYMLDIGWRPALDTLAKISQWNEWVRIHHIEQLPVAESTLFAIILKSGAVERGFSEEIISQCINHNYEIISDCILEGEIQREAIRKLRGGVWNDGLKDNRDIRKYYPSKIIILMDKSNRGETGIRQLKESLRSWVDDSNTSYIHSTDNDIETWDYIKICMPNHELELKTKVSLLKKNNEINHIKFSGQYVSYKFLVLKRWFKSKLLSLISH